MHGTNVSMISVYSSSDGICHVYVDKSANMDMARHIIIDAKLDYPAACNAMVISLITVYCSIPLSLLFIVPGLMIAKISLLILLDFSVKETILVHQDLTNAGGFQELILELKHEGIPSLYAKLLSVSQNSLHGTKWSF